MESMYESASQPSSLSCQRFQAVIHNAPQRIKFSHPNSIGVLALIPQEPQFPHGPQYGVHVWKCWPTIIDAMPGIQTVIHNAPQGVQFSHSNYPWVPSPIPQLPQYGSLPLFPTEPHYGVHIWMCWPIDVLWGQPIKLIHVFSTLEFHELMEWHCFHFFIPSTLCRASEASNIDCFKNWVWKFLTKNLNSLLKNRYFGALIFQQCEFFDH